MNPYRSRPDHAFWRRGVAAAGHELDPVIDTPWRIGRTDRIATAGSCFAQHISRTLAARGYNYFVAEPAPADDPAPENYGVFSARFGNIYTARQLRQLFERAYGLFRPLDEVWTRPDGRLVDPFRPQIAVGGFASEAEVLADRRRHLAAVRTMFEECDVFVFTLGLTEHWASVRDGAVFPLAPGVAGGEAGDAYRFCNFTVADIVGDMREFVRRLRVVNPGVKAILTVSPVPLIATYAERHVLVSNTYSKAALRAAAQEIVDQDEGVIYFPSYEMITGPHTAGRYFAEDLRSVTPEGVAYVMDVFGRHLLGETGSRPAPQVRAAPPTDEQLRAYAAMAELVCDEEALDAP